MTISLLLDELYSHTEGRPFMFEWLDDFFDGESLLKVRAAVRNLQFTSVRLDLGMHGYRFFESGDMYMLVKEEQ